MNKGSRRVGWASVLLVGLGAAACDSGAPPASQPSAQSAAANTVEGWRESLRDALARLDTSTAEGRRELHTVLRREWEAHRGQLDTLSHELRAATREHRQAALAKAQELTDQLERQLDNLEDAGSEQWSEVKTKAVEHAERLRLELEQLLSEKTEGAQDQR